MECVSILETFLPVARGGVGSSRVAPSQCINAVLAVTHWARGHVIEGRRNPIKLCVIIIQKADLPFFSKKKKEKRKSDASRRGGMV